MAEGRGGVVKLSFSAPRHETSPIHLQSKNFQGLRSRASRIQQQLRNRLTTPPRPSATPPPAEEGSRLQQLKRILRRHRHQEHVSSSPIFPRCRSL